MTRAAFEPLPIEAYRDLVRHALAEDVGRGDVTTTATVAPEQRATAVLLAKCACVIAGLDVACEAFRQCDDQVEIRRLTCDGERLDDFLRGH